MGKLWRKRDLECEGLKLVAGERDGAVEGALEKKLARAPRERDREGKGPGTPRFGREGWEGL